MPERGNFPDRQPAVLQRVRPPAVEMQFDVAHHALDFGEQLGVFTLCHPDQDDRQETWTSEDLSVPVDGGIHAAVKIDDEVRHSSPVRWPEQGRQRTLSLTTRNFGWPAPSRVSLFGAMLVSYTSGAQKTSHGV